MLANECKLYFTCTLLRLNCLDPLVLYHQRPEYWLIHVAGRFEVVKRLVNLRADLKGSTLGLWGTTQAICFDTSVWWWYENPCCIHQVGAILWFWSPTSVPNSGQKALEPGQIRSRHVPRTTVGFEQAPIFGHIQISKYQDTILWASLSYLAGGFNEFQDIV